MYIFYFRINKDDLYEVTFFRIFFLRPLKSVFGALFPLILLVVL